MKLGIIGPPRSGKTTVFNALTKRTGESVPPGAHAVPVLGVVNLLDERVDWLSRLYRPRKITYAQMTYMDLQGTSASIENKHAYIALLLTHMRPMDGLVMVVRNFPEPSLPAPDPWRDFRELEDEFLIADLATVEKRLERLSAEEKKGKKPTGPEKELLEKCHQILDEGKPLRTEPQIASAPELRGFTFLSGKPLLVIVNNADDDPLLPEITFPHAQAFVVRGRLEMELAQLGESDAEEFMKDFDVRESAMDRIVAHSHALLNLVTFFTVGEDEVRAWTIPRDLPAVEAAGVVHTDMKKGFIRAEVVSYKDLKEAGDYAAARKHGVVRLEGKTYPVQDGDIIHFRFNV